MRIFLLVFLCSPLFSYSQKNPAKDCFQKIEQARVFFEEENLVHTNKIIQKLETSASASCQAALFLLQGEINLFEGDYTAAELLLNDALVDYTQLKDKKGIIRAYYWLAMTHIENDVPEKASKCLDKIIDETPVLEELGLLYDVLDIRAMVHSGLGEHEKAMSFLKIAANHAIRQKNAPIQVQLLNQVSTNYQAQGQIDSAIFYYNKLLKIKKDIQDFSGLLSDYSTVGNLHRELGNYEAAQTAFIEAIRYGEKLQDIESLLAVYVNIANVYLDQRLLEPALEYVQKAQNLAKENGALLKEGECLQIKGSIFVHIRQTDQALLNYQKAFEIYQQLGLKQQMADTQLKIANLFDSTDNLEKAEIYLREALQIRLETTDPLGELEAKLSLCDVLLKLDKGYTEIPNWLNDCAAIATRTNNATGLQETYRLQSLLNEKKGNHKIALTKYRLHNQIRDSMLNQENAKTVRELEKRYETEKKDREIAQQQIEIKLQKTALQERNTQIVQLLAGLLVLIILVFLTIMTYQRNKQFNKQKLSVLEKEQETQMLRAMVSGEEQERRRIARDLHDGLGAIMATVKMRVSALSNQFPELKKQESYQKSEELIDDACNNIREISHNMMPGSLSRYGLEVAIEDMCEAIQKANDIEVSFIPFGLDQIMDEVVEINIYRIVQELIKNVLKHADASEVIVQLSLEEEHLNITVEDDGKGFDITFSKIKEGLGIGSIRSRVLYLKGKMEIDTQIGRGSTFIIDIPIETNQKQQLLWSKS